MYAKFNVEHQQLTVSAISKINSSSTAISIICKILLQSWLTLKLQWELIIQCIVHMIFFFCIWPVTVSGEYMALNWMSTLVCSKISINPQWHLVALGGSYGVNAKSEHGNGVAKDAHFVSAFLTWIHLSLRPNWW